MFASFENKLDEKLTELNEVRVGQVQVLNVYLFLFDNGKIKSFLDMFLWFLYACGFVLQDVWGH